MGYEESRKEGSLGISSLPIFLGENIIRSNKRRIKMISQDTTASFTWGFGKEFFLETDEGNFVWNDPDYQGG